MQKIQNSNGPTGRGNIESENSTVGRFNKLQKNLDQNNSIIIQANKRVRLYSILKNYNVKFIQNYKSQIWSQPITCPFPSHKMGRERTPSWGYNFVDDRFYCLGCKKSGKAVEFISEIESKDKYSVAKSIIEHYSDYDTSIDIVYDDPGIDAMIFEASSLIRNFMKESNKSNSAAINKITWWFDSFIINRFGSDSVKKQADAEEMRYRITLLKSLLDSTRA